MGPGSSPKISREKKDAAINAANFMGPGTPPKELQNRGPGQTPNSLKLNNDQAVGPGPNSEKNYTFQAAIG